MPHIVPFCVVDTTIIKLDGAVVSRDDQLHGSRVSISRARLNRRKEQIAQQPALGSCTPAWVISGPSSLHLGTSLRRSDRQWRLASTLVVLAADGLWLGHRVVRATARRIRRASDRP
ncbi:hypothetical protein CRV24_000848 [Beauveria bassiana]|nr:hypothetical protein CRV24_000848 [Beauveria bassiana]